MSLKQTRPHQTVDVHRILCDLHDLRSLQGIRNSKDLRAFLESIKMEEVTIIVEDVGEEVNDENGLREEDISDHDGGDYLFEGFQLAVKEMNTKITSYPDLVNIELSESCESLTNIHEDKQRYLNLCKSRVTRSHENLNSLRNTSSNENLNSLTGSKSSYRTDDDHFCWMTSSCPDLSSTCCGSHDHFRQNKADTDSRRRESDEFVEITINENDNRNENEDGNREELFCCSDDDIANMFDCTNIFTLFKTLRLQKQKSQMASKNSTKTLGDSKTNVQLRLKTGKSRSSDFSLLQEMLNKWASKIKTINVLQFQPKECGMELPNVVGDKSTVEEVGLTSTGCIPTTVFR